MSTPTIDLRNFTFTLPEGFVPMPVHQQDVTADRLAQLGADLAELFGLPADDQNAAEVAVHLAAFGTVAGADGVDYTAVGIYRSPDRPDEPVMVLVSAVAVASSHDRPQIAVDSLLEMYQRGDQGSAYPLGLPTGPAVAVVTEQPQELVLSTDQRIPLLRRQVTAWVPDSSGSTLAAISVSTNNWRDWEHICELALGIFETLRWEAAHQDAPASPEL